MNHSTNRNDGWVKFFNLSILILLLLNINACKSEINPVKNLTLLPGTWKSAGTITFYEHWNQLHDSSYTGAGFSTNGSDTLYFEYFSIRLINDTLHYLAKVPGKNEEKEISFKLKSYDNNSLIFENLKHDYPNRIIYKFLNDSILNTTIENKNGNKQKKFMLKKQKASR